jgi:signal transduction histidine kinase
MGDVTFDAAGRPARYLITIQDVTELREAERQRDEFQRQMLHTQRLEALGTLAGGIAHDLNNTLVPVLALAKLMLKDRPEGEERRNLEVIQRAGEQARDLVRRVLAFARKGPIERKPVDLRAVVDDALKMLRVSVPPRIAIEERLGAVAPVLADAGQIHQVVVNLVTNAAQAIGERDGTISISLGTRPGDPGSIRLAVADDGPGMSDAVQARVFEPFFSTKGIGAGSGLGLSIVHGIVTGHGGSVAVDSRPGRGARFTVDLPAATTPSAMTSAAASAAA